MIEKGIKDSRIDYEAMGCIKSNPANSVGLYIFAGVLIIAGIIVYFAVMPEMLVFLIFVFLAVLSALTGAASAKLAWFWDDEKFTVCQFLAKPVTYSYRDIGQIYVSVQGITLEMRNGKQYVISRHDKGSEEFLLKLKAKSGGYPGWA